MTTRLVVFVFLLLVPVLAHASNLDCAGESGPLLTAEEGRITLTQAGRGRSVQMDQWSICFRCVGLPRLDVTFKEVGAVKADVRLFADSRPCEVEGGVTAPERHCVAAAFVRVGDLATQTCRFPEGTTLGTLWQALTRSRLPGTIDPWWSYPQR